MCTNLALHRLVPPLQLTGICWFLTGPPSFTTQVPAQLGLRRACTAVVGQSPDQKVFCGQASITSVVTCDTDRQKAAVVVSRMPTLLYVIMRIGFVWD